MFFAITLIWKSALFRVSSSSLFLFFLSFFGRTDSKGKYITQEPIAEVECSSIDTWALSKKTPIVSKALSARCKRSWKIPNLLKVCTSALYIDFKKKKKEKETKSTKERKKKKETPFLSPQKINIYIEINTWRGRANLPSAFPSSTPGDGGRKRDNKYRGQVPSDK